MNFLLVYSISIIGLIFLIINAFLFNTNKKVSKKVSKVFLWYLILLSVIEFSCNAIGILKPNANFFISHFYFGFQFVFVSLLYYKLIRNVLIRKLIATIAIVELGYLLSFYVINPEKFWVFNTYEIISTSVILVIYALYFLFVNLELQHKYFNFSIGLILYLTCSITIFLSGHLELVLCEEPYIDIWVFNSLFYIVFQIFVYREYLFVKRTAKIVN